MNLPNWTRHLRPVVAAGALLLLTSACYATLQPATEATVWVDVGPPSPRYEARPASPGPEFIWIVGYSQWSGSAYTWAPGRWERRPHPRAQWVKGRWHHERRGWRYSEGRWNDRR